MLLARRLRLSVAALLAAHVATTTASVSLSEFVPRIDSLPAPCSTVYNQVIKGCLASDFDVTKRCSSACVDGLIAISQEVNKACSLDDVSETSIIGVFLMGKGIPILCVGVSVTTIGASSTTSTKTTSTNTPATQSQQSSTTSNTRAPSSTLATSAVNSAASSITEAPPASTVASLPSFIWSLPQPTQTTSSQKSNSDSGGGSPFDVVATGSSPQSHTGTGLLGAVLGLAALACIAL